MPIKSIFEKFDTVGTPGTIEPYGNGHINDTYLVTAEDGGALVRYILQRVNTNVFKKADVLMNNFAAVTEHLKSKVAALGGDVARECLSLVPTKSGELYLVTEDGDYWRLLHYIEKNVCYDKVERPEQFYESAVAFGNFQRLLSDFPIDKIEETITNFHNTEDRFNNLLLAVEADAVGRLDSCRSEVEFAMERRDFCTIFERAYAEGRLPKRVTHNDTKLNNILFDLETGRPICVIDLDTVMPGYAVNDFGDSIRFGANTAAEDERDLSKVLFDMELYELYVKGFIEGAAGSLTDAEIEFLPYAAKMMTLECGMRFLTDHLSGDTYFKIHRENHNLDRARNQFKLVSEMEKHFDEMIEITRKYK